MRTTCRQGRTWQPATVWSHLGRQFCFTSACDAPRGPRIKTDLWATALPYYRCWPIGFVLRRAADPIICSGLLFSQEKHHGPAGTRERIDAECYTVRWYVVD